MQVHPTFTPGNGSPSYARRRAATYLAVFVALGIASIPLAASGWKGDAQFHTILASVATAGAVTVGPSALALFYRRPYSAYLPIAAWIACVVVGLGSLARYSYTPGPAGAAPLYWPEGSELPRRGDLPSLVMFLHPRCPCSRASLEELNRVLARCKGRMTTSVVFVRPPGAAEDFGDTDLRRQAARAERVSVVEDGDGVEARRFGATTSGHTLLYAADGRLVFRGGITPARGHAGDNAGESAVTSWLTTGRAERSTAPVFGCPLLDPSDCLREKAPCHQ